MHNYIIIFLVATACNDTGSHAAKVLTGQITANKNKTDTTKTFLFCPDLVQNATAKPLTLNIAGFAVDILLPLNPIHKGDILLLPGWGYERQRWCTQSTFCEKARKQGYRLVLPEMGRSLYMDRHYPETRADLRSAPTRTWLNQILIPTLQLEYCIFETTKPNFLVGLSYGARGVVLVLPYWNRLFKAAAVLSGDYDMARPKYSKLVAAAIGEFEKFSHRWKGENNPIRQIHKWKIPIYLGHGQADTTANPYQTKLFYDTLRNRYPDMPVKLSMPKNKGHNFAYWDSEVDSILAFFNTYYN